MLDTAVSQYLAGELDAAGAEQAIADGWNAISDEAGKDAQLAAYVASLGVSGSPATADQGSLTIDGQAPETREPRRAITSLGAWRSDGAARWLFIWPTVLFILVLSLFPLVASLALSLSKLAFHQGGVDLQVHRLHQLPAAAVRS